MESIKKVELAAYKRGLNAGIVLLCLSIIIFSIVIYKKNETIKAYGNTATHYFHMLTPQQILSPNK